MNEWVRAVLVIVITLFAVPWFARLRDRWSRTSRFGTQMIVLLIVSLVLTLMFATVPSLALYISYGASFAFAFVYPYTRARLRKRYTRTVTPAPKE